jgi:hypothetical protein
MPNCFDYPSVFVDANKNLVMVDDVTTPLNLAVTPIE